MKKVSKLLLCALLAMSMVGCTKKDTKGIFTAGQYSAEQNGYGGKVTVTITTDTKTITEVVIVGDNETPSIGGAALEKLAEQIKTAQNAEIDGVSGATLTSKAVKAAAQQAIDQAQGKEAATKTALKDGTYTAEAESYGWTGLLKGEVVIKDNAISAITILEESDSHTGEIYKTAFDFYIPRVIEAQSLAVDAISGATVTSNAIRTIVEDAIAQAGGDANQWYTSIEKKSDTVKLEGYDVIVVGLGGSGILSYCAAAQAGATVFGIETAAKLGGQSATTTGPMVIDSKSEAFKDVTFANPDEVYQVWMDYLESDEKADIIHEAVYNSGNYLDFYIDNFDFEFSGMILSFANPSWSQFWTRYVGENGTTNVLGPNKTYQFDRAMEKAKGLNDKNDYQLELTASELIIENGQTIGVKAVGYDGVNYEIYGDSVILATGGFIGNAEMVEKYLGKGPQQNIAAMVNDGTGITMGLQAGGTTYMPSVDPVIHILQIPHMIKNQDLTNDQKAILSALALVKGETAVNVKGEALDPTLVESMIPDYQYYVVYTEEQINDFKTKGFTENFKMATSHFLSQGGTFEVGTPIADLDTILEVGMKYQNVFKASSIKELAAALQVDETTLSATLNGNETTYYAVACVGYSYGTVGGLDVDVNMNVLREDGTVIENLFAVGNDSMGVENIEGKPYTPWGGQAQSWTFVSGYLAGNAAATYGTSK